MWFQNILCYFLVMCALFFISIYVYFQYKFMYWKKKNVPCDPPEFPFGYLRDIVFRRKHFLCVHERIYKDHPEKAYVGIYSFSWPQLLLRDPNIIKAVLSTNGEEFSARGMLLNKELDPYTESILSYDGNDIKYKTIRAKFNESITIGKIKVNMFETMLAYSENLILFLKKYDESGEPFDLRDSMSKYALDVFGASILGIHCNSFEDTFNPYKVMSCETFAPKSYLNYTRVIMSLLAPELISLLGMTFCERQVIEFYTYVWHQMIENRAQETTQRNDLVKGLLDLLWKHDDNVDPADRTKFTHEEIVSSLIPTSAAGYESSASMLSFAFYQLAQHPTIQDKARKEVQETVKRHGGFTYDAILDMKYIGAILDEILRMYPSIPILFRQNTKRCKLPHTDFTMEEGTRCIIPLYALLRDQNLFPEPDKFNPERELSDVARMMITLPFGLGQRICPGKRFSLIEGRVAISKVLSKYRLRPAHDAPTEIVPEPGSVSYLSKYPTWAKLEEINRTKISNNTN